jgi:hypothetical protein
MRNRVAKPATFFKRFGLALSLGPTITRVVEFAPQPGTGIGPVTIGCSMGHTKAPSRLFQRQAGEEAQFDQLGNYRFLDGEAGQRLIDREELAPGGVDCQLRLQQLMPLPAAAMPLGLFAAGIVDEDAAHGLGGRGKEVTAAIPMAHLISVLKALAKDPAHRYQTATELAADLKRFVEDRPIRARRVSVRERFWRWCRRNPLVASLTAAMATLLVAVAIGASIAAVSFRQVAAEAADARRTTVLTLADTYTSFGLAAGTRDDPRQAVLWFAEAARLAGDDQERADANRTRAAQHFAKVT